jgi:6-phosphogluconolactonase (cycloisomerase 2 family)
MSEDAMAKRRKLFGAISGLVAISALVLGCNGFFTDEDDGNGGGTTARFVYVANSGSNNISAFVANTTTGALTAATNSPFAAGTSPESVGADDQGRFLYAANSGGGVSAYLINRNDGSLTQATGSPFTAGTAPFAVGVDPDGRFVYIGNNGSSNVSGFSITTATAALTPVPNAPFATTANPLRLRVDPAGRFVYVATGASGTDIFPINSDGSLGTRITEPPTVGQESQDVVVEPAGQFAYVANGIGGVSAYAVNASSGALTLIQPTGGGDFFAAGTTPLALAVTPNGDFLYVANFGSNNVSGYRIGADGRLTAVTGSPFAAGTNPVSLSVDPSGSFLYVANQGGGISIFTIGATTGTLASGGTATAGTTPASIVTTP